MTQDAGLDLDGRIALVTGGSGGIGAALAGRLGESGVDVALTYGGNRDDAERAADRVRAAGRRAVVLGCDMADLDAVGGLVDRVADELGAPDVLVPAAGVGVLTAWPDIELDRWQHTLTVNTTAPFLLCQRALPGMVERGFGRILLVSSVAGITGGSIGAHYAASKSALHGLAHHLAARVAADGVTVNVLAPALVAGTRILPGDDPAQLVGRVPVGRLGTVEEQADFALAILRNGYLTSKVLTLDGGIHPG